MDNVQKKSRPLDSSDEDAGSPKKRKISFENDEATLPETIQADTIPTQPLSLTASKTQIPSTIPTQLLGITSSPPLQSLHITQPTQALRPPTPPNKGVIQVPCSSPFRTQQSTPTATRTLPPTEKGFNSVRPLDFYKNSAANPINLDSQGPHYVAPSDSEISDNEIQPVFAGASKQNANSVVQVPVSPVAMHNIRARYTYAPKPQIGRLDSLNKRPGVPGGIMQRRPEPAKPAGDIKLEDIISPEHRAAVERMKSIAPNRTISQLLHTLIEHKGNFDDAMERITRDDGDDGDVVDLTGDSVGRQSFKTANRGIGAGKVAIKDKWSSTQAVKRDLTASPPAAAPARKRKLIRGGNRGSLEKDRSESPAEAIQLDDSDSEAEEDGDSEDERELEEKVLKYINKCDVKELSDFASTTEEIAKAIIDARPFKNIDSIREVSLATAAPAGKRRGRAKPVGDKVIDVCIETWRGYVAVDSLIRKVEALGKPLAESIKAWGVDVHTGGELEMTDLVESDSNSTKDSGVGTPTDDGENDIKGTKRTRSFKEQPKNLREGVVLKDYQLAGINWLNLLYEKKLSCILADEMGMFHHSQFMIRSSLTTMHRSR
jgi:SWI/SNF-related matrix-associated actin-dependent regulator 1 of chromatin subfamily A